MPALPGARGEAEDLDLDAAALQRAGENIGAGCSNGDRASAHGAGIVDQEAHDGVAELRVLLLLEGECLERIHHDARQPRGIENAFFEIEIPGAVLLRHQPALETVGEASDDTLQIGQLLVEIGAQAGELLASQSSSAWIISSNFWV